MALISSEGSDRDLSTALVNNPCVSPGLSLAVDPGAVPNAKNVPLEVTIGAQPPRSDLLPENGLSRQASRMMTCVVAPCSISLCKSKEREYAWRTSSAEERRKSMGIK